MAIITKSDVKDYLNIGDTTYDDFIDVLVLYAANAIENIIGYNIEEQARTIVFNGNLGGQVITRNEYLFLEDIITDPITSLKKRDDPLSSYETIDSSKYSIFKTNNVSKLYYDTGFADGTGNYEIKYISGWATAAMPKAIKNVAVEMCALQYKESNVDSVGRLGLVSDNVNNLGQTATQSFKDMLPRWEKALARYRVPVV